MTQPVAMPGDLQPDRKMELRMEVAAELQQES
jgi:hypothetical protein